MASPTLSPQDNNEKKTTHSSDEFRCPPHRSRCTRLSYFVHGTTGNPSPGNPGGVRLAETAAPSWSTYRKLRVLFFTGGGVLDGTGDRWCHPLLTNPREFSFLFDYEHGLRPYGCPTNDRTNFTARRTKSVQKSIFRFTLKSINTVEVDNGTNT